jgi:predicted Zn-dependent protease with MMP-like domain
MRLSPDEFRQLVEEALDELPDRFRDARRERRHRD